MREDSSPQATPSVRSRGIIWRSLSSPSLAVATALVVRMLLLWLSHHGEDLGNPRYMTVGLEARLIAVSLASGKGFFGPYPGYAAITACIAPLYPFLWAIGIKIFHLQDFGATVFSQIMNCAFSAATCWPIFSIGKIVFGRRMGLASAWLWVFLPYAVLLPLEWTWDQSLSALLLAIVIQATLHLKNSNSGQSLTWYGLLWGLTALANPAICILMPFLLGWLIHQRGQSVRSSLVLVGKVMLVFVLVLLPWTIRNYYAIDGLVFVKSNFGLELWLGNNPAVKEVYSPERHPIENFPERISLILNGEPNYNRMKEHQAIAYIERYPRVFLRNLSDRFVDTWAATFDSKVEPWVHLLHLRRADIWFSSVFSIISIVGLILAVRINLADTFPLVVCLLVFPIPYYITHSALRYRHPIDPVMAIFAVYAVGRLVQVFSPRRSAEKTAAPLYASLQSVNR